MDDTRSNDVAEVNGTSGAAGSESKGEETTKVYEKKDDAYFGYYALLSHQAQMLQDSVRTTAYQRAILGNAVGHYQNKLVMDVGAGNGILSLFALQAGAKKVYAVEASDMVEYLKHVAAAASGKPGPMSRLDEDEQWYLEAQGHSAQGTGKVSNSWIGNRLVPVHSKAEDVTAAMLDGNDKVDTIVSECLGVLLLHERMCESFIDARDRFLKPGGAMFPSAGTICFAPIEDKPVWDETAVKARFWQNQSFYNVDLTPFFASAWREAFSSPVIGCFNPQTILSTTVEHDVDFQTVTMDQLKTFEIPLNWTIQSTGLMHGIGGWFDLSFQPAVSGSDPASGDTTDEGDDPMTESELGHQHNAAAAASSNLSGTAPPFQPSASTGSSSSAAGALLAAAASASSASGSASNAYEILASAAANGTSSSFMSTSPRYPPTHWQQARLLLPEPLAVNRGQMVTGSMKFKVNEQRSYDIEAELLLVDGANAKSESTRSTRRRCHWKLDKQTYSWTTTPSV